MQAELRWGPREGWLSVLLLAIVVWSVVHSIEEAAWAEHLDALVPLAMLGVLVGLAAAKSGLKRWVAHAAALLLGIEAIVLLFGNRMTATSWEGKLAELVWHVHLWLYTAVTGGNSRDNVMFALFMAALAWLLAYGSSWLVFALGRGGWAVALNGALCLLHLSYSYATLNYHFFILLFAGLLLIVRLELLRRQAFWARSGLEVQGQVVRNVVLTSAVAIVLVMGLARQGPAEQPSSLLGPIWARVLDSWQRGQAHVDRLFGGVQGPPVVVVGLAFGSTMQPREGFELGTQPVLKIESPLSRYWRTMTYATYTGQGMVAGDVHGDRFEADQSLPLPFEAGEAREELVQTITVLAPQSNLVFAADAPVRVSVPTLVEWRDQQADPAVVRLAQMLQRGQQYTVVSLTSVASEAQLRAAGSDYPPGIEKYLQLPDTLPDRVRTVAAEVTAGGPTAYDKALAIEAYLRNLTYETHVAPPPADRDWVDYTLFDQRTGYADSYATAMVVMLRTLGIPSRVVTGFAPGTFDENEAAYIAYESDAHAWVEAFFPRLGWINFEPSNLRALPFRPAETTATITDLSGIVDGYAGGSEDFYLEDAYLDGYGEHAPALPARRDEAWVVALGVLVAILVAVGISWFALVALFKRGLRSLPWHAQWYGQFRRLATWAGLGGKPSQTPYEYADWLETRYPGTRGMVRPIADCYVRGAYSGREPDPEMLARAAKAWEQARGPLARRVLLRWVVAARDQLQAARKRFERSAA
ncbi:MAG: DUF3488 and transglutaminase-like domain-containing protein [Chloroflexota bacterium]|nr:DUF3488 and transglutaminase-like domain-containing protein [Chloroflexota bacterium]